MGTPPKFIMFHEINKKPAGGQHKITSKAHKIVFMMNFPCGEIKMFTKLSWRYSTWLPFCFYNSKNIKYWTTYKTTCIQNRFNDSSNKYCTVQTSFVFRDRYKFVNKRLFFNYVIGSFIIIWALKLISLPSKQALKIKL